MPNLKLNTVAQPQLVQFYRVSQKRVEKVISNGKVKSKTARLQIFFIVIISSENSSKNGSDFRCFFWLFLTDTFYTKNLKTLPNDPNDLSSCDLNLSEEEIGKMSRWTFKKLVHRKIKEQSETYLKELQMNPHCFSRGQVCLNI